MPQGAGEASLLAGSFPEPKVADLKEANASLKRLLQQDVPVPIGPIPLERLKLVVFADSSLANAGGGKSQIRHMAMCSRPGHSRRQGSRDQLPDLQEPQGITEREARHYLWRLTDYRKASPTLNG